MHILFLTHYFPPEVNAPASRTCENARRWVRAGHRVSVITCAPNHPHGIVYPGYENRLWQLSDKDGIGVLRVKTYLSANRGVARRSLNYLSYLPSATAFCRRVRDVDLVVSTSPQFFCGLAGYFVSRRHGCPWVVEIRDLWPESIQAVGAVSQKGALSLLERLELFLYRKPDHIVALTNSFKQHMIRKGIEPGKVSIVTNGADLDLFTPQPRENEFRALHGLSGKFVASFVGTHGMAHALETVLQAARLLQNRPEIVFLLVGDGAERARILEERDRMGLNNVLMLPQQTKDMVPQILAASDACMVLLRRTELFKTVIPSKIFEAMAMERPILLGVEGESRGIIERSECGLAIEPEDADALAEGVMALYSDPERAARMGNNGAAWVQQHYNRDMLAARYLDILTAVRSGRRHFAGSAPPTTANDEGTR